MTQPQDTNRLLIEAIDRLNQTQGANSIEIHELVDAVEAESQARDRKVAALSNTVATLRRTNLLLLGVATLLLLLIGASIAVGIRNQDQTIINRETTAVIAICQRQNPNDTTLPADVNTRRLVECVQEYFPGFELPVTDAER